MFIDILDVVNSVRFWVLLEVLWMDREIDMVELVGNGILLEIDALGWRCASIYRIWLSPNHRSEHGVRVVRSLNSILEPEYYGDHRGLLRKQLPQFTCN